MQFLGAAGTVTGSRHLVEAAGKRVLLDCGLFQGLKELRERNWAEPTFAPERLDAIVLSHAHIDHTGYLPLVVRRGFHGPIYCTAGTADLLQVMLPDSAHIQEEDAERANRKGYSKHKPALPLYTTEDAVKTLKLIVPRPYTAPFAPADGITVIYRPSGHILGSATIELRIDGTPPATLVFSGDLGRWNRPILKDPELVPMADVLLLESTYGDRSHPPEPAEALARVVRDSAARGGPLLVPAFALGRTQELIWHLRELEEEGRIPSLPVYVDSPMAVDVTGIHLHRLEEHDVDMAAMLEQGKKPLAVRQFTLVRTAEESKKLNSVRGPIIIISASGMATGGRIVHHLKHRVSDDRTTVLLAGFQSAGTRGRALQDGARDLMIHGSRIPVNAKIVTLDGLSAHAGQDELMKWLDGFERPPKATYLVHGEPKPASALTDLIREKKGWNVRPAKDQERVEL